MFENFLKVDEESAGNCGNIFKEIALRYITEHFLGSRVRLFGARRICLSHKKNEKKSIFLVAFFVVCLTFCGVFGPCIIFVKKIKP